MENTLEMFQGALDVMVLEPDLMARQQFKKLVGGNLRFGRCIASSTLEEASKRVESGARVDGFFLSARFDLNLLGGFVETNRATLNSRAANLLVLRRGVSIHAKELKAVDADGFLLEPQVASDLDGSAGFIHSFKEQLAHSKEEEPAEPAFQTGSINLRALCSRLALAVDKGPGHPLLFDELRKDLEKLPKEAEQEYFKTLIDIFTSAKASKLE